MKEGKEWVKEGRMTRVCRGEGKGRMCVGGEGKGRVCVGEGREEMEIFPSDLYT